jgi:alkylation response protein AidB-like acyl-CoA dehydrogenase
MLADIKVILESSLAVTTQAARQLDQGDVMASFTAAAATRHTCHKVIDCLQLCVQVHGGIGVTIECDLHVLIRRATLLRFLFADPYSSARRIVTLYADRGPRYV